MADIAHLRKEYQLQSLSESEVEKNPISQFSTWWKEALASEIDGESHPSGGKQQLQVVKQPREHSQSSLLFNNVRRPSAKPDDAPRLAAVS